ncbi:response regulator [Legionella longbeachae]|uniref:Putative response regulator n=2 Tax=Legionella longbeachae TaxID=450 RepID=D3HJM4_LEGLN|nr:response regulator [Legionella longbeachae]VEE03152.1 response regulator [Legionella oakridgensis]ARB93948.1 PAS domain S-box protein [Legionella longbeachae]ARM32914.1 response regulator [Legionella longbeachae]QEY52074.1 response regulator [Legionella longbeachae]QIN32877.1 response regulator [Legionella longbeachae]
MENSPTSQIYTRAFTKMDNMVYLIDKDGFLIDCNANLLRFLGYRYIEDNSIGSIYEMMRQQGLWTSEQIHSFQQQDIAAIISGKNEVEQQAIINTQGTILYFEISRIPLADKSGNALGLAVTIRDISKLKQLTDQVKNLKSQVNYNHKTVTNNLSSETTGQINKLKILLIEDNLIAQKAEKTILMNCKCLTDVVATASQACEIFKPAKYDLILMDLTLEEGDGYNLTATLRKQEQGTHCRVPIIALTGHDPMDVGFNCEDAEMDGILRKPLTIQQANQLIQRYIRHIDIKVTGLMEFKQ